MLAVALWPACASIFFIASCRLNAMPKNTRWPVVFEYAIWAGIGFTVPFLPLVDEWPGPGMVLLMYGLVVVLLCSARMGRRRGAGRSNGQRTADQPSGDSQMNDELHLGSDGTEICHHYEKLRLQAYPDPGSPRAKAQRAGKPSAGLSGAPWTIGWGDTGPDVVEGLTITVEEADQRFARRMALEFEPAVRRVIKVPLNQRQFDALVSIFYNAGVGNMSGSTLVRLLNLGDYAGAAGQFPRWNQSGGEVMKGLQRRREAERLVFLGTDARSAIVSGEAKYP
jgi:lysozyme